MKHYEIIIRDNYTGSGLEFELDFFGPELMKDKFLEFINTYADVINVDVCNSNKEFSEIRIEYLK